MTYYEVIAGSRSYGLEIAGSDIDLCRVADGWEMWCHDNYNLIQIPREEFLNRVFCRSDNAYYFQWFFPACVRSDNQVSSFILTWRESIMRAQRASVYQILMGHAERLELYADQIYAQYPKRMAYSILLYSIAARYGEGGSFEEAHRPDRELRRFLLSVRKNQVAVEDAKALLSDVKRKAIAASEFYIASPDTDFLHDAEFELRKLLGL